MPGWTWCAGLSTAISPPFSGCSSSTSARRRWARWPRSSPASLRTRPASVPASAGPDPVAAGSDDLRARRLDLVREHMASENEHRFEDTLQTFDHPRYELIPTGEVFDGRDAVAEYYRASRAAFPDQRNENS